MAHHVMPRQRELFTAAGPPESLPPQARQLLLALLETLLLEVVAPASPTREGGDEQDPA